MKTRNIISFFAAISSIMATVSVVSCSKDVPVGDPVEITGGYVLPQSGASDEDNARIMEIYEKWSSYVLYDVDSVDVYWKQISGNASSGGMVYVFKEGDPKYVGDMLDYLDEIWWHYFPDEFLQKGGIPFRVYLVEEYYSYRDWGGGQTSAPLYMDYQINDNSIMLSGMSQVASYDADTKRAKKVALLSDLFTNWISKSIIGTPSEFYNVSDYNTEPEMTTDDGYSYYYTDEQLKALRNRGFIPKYNSYGYSVYDEIYMAYSGGTSSWTYNDPRSNDFNYYISQIFHATEEQVADFLQYETVKTKWNIILDYYKDNYGIDLRAMATE